MKARHKRLAFVIVGLAGLTVVAALIFNAFNSNMVFFFSPSDVLAQKTPTDKTFRIGGIVEEGSLERENDGLTVSFVVTDYAEKILVTYTGILPDLFQEGQSVIAQGKLNLSGEFKAVEVLAKHDETYMSPEVADAIERAKQQKDNAEGLQNVSNNEGAN